MALSTWFFFTLLWSICIIDYLGGFQKIVLADSIPVSTEIDTTNSTNWMVGPYGRKNDADGGDDDNRRPSTPNIHHGHHKCPHGTWMTPETRSRREKMLQEYVERERTRMNLPTPKEMLSKNRESITRSCFYDKSRIYGYEHPLWPKHAHSAKHTLNDKMRKEMVHHRTILPQIYHIDKGVGDVRRNKDVYVHLLWKSAATCMERGFGKVRRNLHPDESVLPPGCVFNNVEGTNSSAGNQNAISLLFTRDPMRRFASGVSEVLYRAVHKGNIAHHEVKWWHHVTKHQGRGDIDMNKLNLTVLVEGMLRDVEQPRGCMGKANPLHHLRSAGMFYSEARYPDKWMYRNAVTKAGKQKWSPIYHRLVTVGPPKPEEPSGEKDTTVEDVLREYGGNPLAIHNNPKNRRDGSIKPKDIPRTDDILAEIYNHPKTFVRRVCRVYAADYICFGWKIPHECKDMFER
jgi:hypothetical protein